MIKESDLEQLYKLFVPKKLFDITEYELKERIRALEKEISEIQWSLLKEK